MMTSIENVDRIDEHRNRLCRRGHGFSRLSLRIGRIIRQLVPHRIEHRKSRGEREPQYPWKVPHDFSFPLGAHGRAGFKFQRINKTANGKTPTSYWSTVQYDISGVNIMFYVNHSPYLKSAFAALPTLALSLLLWTVSSGLCGRRWRRFIRQLSKALRRHLLLE
jgi:hypothetical protein